MSERTQWDVNIAFSAEKKYVVYAETEEEAIAEGEERFFTEVGPSMLRTKALCVDHVTAERQDA